MGQKSNPIGLRLEKTNMHWFSCWYGDYNYTRHLLNDLRNKTFIYNCTQQMARTSPILFFRHTRGECNILLFSSTLPRFLYRNFPAAMPKSTPTLLPVRDKNKILGKEKTKLDSPRKNETPLLQQFVKQFVEKRLECAAKARKRKLQNVGSLLFALQLGIIHSTLFAHLGYAKLVLRKAVSGQQVNNLARFPLRVAPLFSGSDSLFVGASQKEKADRATRATNNIAILSAQSKELEKQRNRQIQKKTHLPFTKLSSKQGLQGFAKQQAGFPCAEEEKNGFSLLFSLRSMQNKENALLWNSRALAETRLHSLLSTFPKKGNGLLDKSPRSAMRSNAPFPVWGTGGKREREKFQKELANPLVKSDSSTVNIFTARKASRKKLNTFLKNYLQYSIYKDFSFMPTLASQLRCKLGLFKCGSIYQNPNFVASHLVSLLQARVPFRQLKHKVIKGIEREMERGNCPKIKGVRISCSGRTPARSKKAQKARTDLIQWGESSLNVFSELVHFASKGALTGFGKIGVKVWICYTSPFGHQ